MLKEASFIEEWLDQAREEATARGKAEAARQMLLRLLRARFGELPESVAGRVESEGPEWCEEVAIRALTAGSLEELGF